MDDFSTWVQKNKALWTRVYDEVITPSFEEEWKKRDDVHARELEKYKDNQGILSSHINESIIKNARLQKENEALIEELANHGKTSLAKEQEPTVAALANATAEHSELADRYANLSKKYDDLSQKIKYLERKNHAIMQKNKDMKDSVRAWQDYVDRQAARPKTRGDTRGDMAHATAMSTSFEEPPPHMPSSPGSVTTVQTAISRTEPGRSLSSRSTPAVETGRSHNNAELTPRASRPIHGPVMPPLRFSMERSVTALRTLDGNDVGEELLQPPSNSHVQAAFPSSSQTTVEEGAASGRPSSYTNTSTNTDDDVPQFVSERSLKRKRDPQSKINIYADQSSDGTPVKPFRVKDEQFSSPPRAQSLFRVETIDLDDVPTHALQTPRRAGGLHLPVHMTRDTIRHQRSNSAPFTQAADVEENPVGQNKGFSPEMMVEPASDTRAVSEPSNVTEVAMEILQPMDTNILAGGFAESLHRRSKQDTATRYRDVGIVIESGEDTPPRNKKRARFTPSTARANVNQRLNARSGIESPASIKIKHERNLPPSISLRVEANAPDATSKRRSRDRMPPPAADDIIPDDRPQWKLTPIVKSSRASRTPRGAATRHSPLRQRAVPDLKLADFKPNPAYNQGYTYAFSETVRNHSDRMCLPGCTNPQCCGSTFRTLAEAQAPLSSSQEAALLEDYLGGAYDSANLTQMATDERDELVLQARTRKLAKETGKHRQAYEGRRTPPGFWRVDFPTTQEQQVDRERAKEQEKQQIHERWLEAQRRGGRWIFRDE